MPQGVNVIVPLGKLSKNMKAEGFTKPLQFTSLLGRPLNRSYDGLNTHVMFLRPSSHIFTILQLKSEHGEFVPYTNTEQDVLETVFSTEESSVQMFIHEHSKTC